MKYWEKFQEKFEALNLKQRALISAGVLLSVFLVFDLLYFQKSSKLEVTLKQRLANTNQELGKLSAQEKVFTEAIAKNPNVALQREILQLQDELARLDNELDTLSVGLVSPEQLPEILRDVIRHEKKLQLLAMHTVDPVAVTLFSEQTAKLGETQTEVDGEEKPKAAEVYKHAVRILVKGSYFNIVKYLKELETLHWKFYWSELDYRVSEYPMAKVMIEVYTLSSGTGARNE